MSDGILLPGRLSYSAVSTYAECGEKFKLGRGYKLDDSTWWASVAGTAVHELTEFYDLDRLDESLQEYPHLLAIPGDRYAEAWNKAAFEAALDKAVAKEDERGTKVIKPSGKQLQSHGKTGGPNKKDRGWWLVEGPKFLQAYINWRKLTKWTIARLPDGQLGIEVRVQVEFGGGPQLGFIDRVFIKPDGTVVIVDIKSGKEPSGKLQLGTYAVGLIKLFGLEADYGAYWMADKGDITGLLDLTPYTEEYVDHLFEMAWTGIRAGVFMPSVGSFCGTCSVRDYCRAVGGRKAGVYPVSDVLIERKAPTRDPRQATVAQITPS